MRRAYAYLVGFICERPRAALLALLLAMVPAAALAVGLFTSIHAGLEELLPKDAPSVRALDQLHERLGGKAHLTVIAQSDDPEINRRFIRELTARLQARHIPQARSIQGSVASERQWIGDHAALLLSRAQFDSLLDDLEAALRKAKAEANPLFAPLDDEPQPQEARWQPLEQRLKQTLSAQDRFPRGYLETPDGKTVVLLVWLQGSEVDIGPSAALMKSVRQEVAALRTSFPAALRVAYTGEVPNLIEEHDAILADLSLSSLIVFVLVGALIVGYFRSWHSVLVVLLGLLPGLVFSFGIGRLVVGHLNSNTAFLGSIIAGNGINYPLLFLAYYRTRPLAEPRASAVVAAARSALPGTLGAALTASAAYGGLAASSFKGFSQFGWLGGVGMLTTWVLTFVATPVGIAIFDPPRQGEQLTRPQLKLIQFFFSRGSLPVVTAATAAALTLSLGALGARRALASGLYEMNIQVLRNRESLRSGSASWDEKMNQLFGVWLNPVAALVEQPRDREPLAAAARAVLTVPRDGPAAAERVETIEQYAPQIPDQEARKQRLRRVEPELRKLSQRELPAELRRFVDAALTTAHAAPITPAGVPESLRQAFEELDGRSDRTVLIFPSLRINYNDAGNLLRFDDQLAQVPLPRGALVGGGFLFMAEIIRLIRDEAPRVVLVVSLLVALVLVPIFRGRPLRIPLTIFTVASVAVVSMAVMLSLGVRVNMLNFAAVPITIGVGADYAVNLFGAMDAFHLDARRAVARMGGAILLCSLTTVVGYLSLVVAQSGALRSFGWAAVLGEIMAVAAVLLVLPVLLPAPRRHEERAAVEQQKESASCP